MNTLTHFIFHFLGYFRNSGSEKVSLVMSEVVFALGDVLSYINNRAFEQVGEFIGKDNQYLNNHTTTNNNSAYFSQTLIDPDIFTSSIESVELLLESLAELYSIKFGSQTVKWAVVATIQILK